MNKYLPYIVAAFVFIVAFISCSESTVKHEDNRITMTTTINGEIVICIIGTGWTTIDWGDGESERTLLIDPPDLGFIYEYEFSHTYTTANTKTITITANNKVTGLATDRSGVVAALDVTACPSLKYLNCNYEHLTSLNLSKNAALVKLKCIGNRLTGLDISKNTALEELMCYDNQLTILDLSKNTELIELGCQNNQLTSLSVNKSPMLKYLYCQGNRLTSLNVSKCTVLESLHCNDNQLSSLDISENIVLRNLYCQDNNLNAGALNTLFNDLPDRTGKTMGGIDVRNNSGVTQAGYNPTIATAKNWSVID
ncbi:MAG: hypothetical protein LBH91_05165 [Prevotellaceae bacterium]|jgi:hypothetical protein|nr:hypothetical protein [Prevotellaceae bacterium]